LCVPGSAQERLSPADIENLLSGGVHQTRIADLIKQRGVNFEWTDDLRNRLKKAGAGNAVMEAIDGAVIRFRLAEKAKRDELKRQQQSADEKRTPKTQADSGAKEQEVTKPSEPTKAAESKGRSSPASEQKPSLRDEEQRNETSQQPIELPSQLKETAEHVIGLKNLKVADGQVSGELLNNSQQGVFGIELQILHSWRWNNDFRPGSDDPGRVDYFTVDKEIAPRQSVPFNYKPSPPLPVRKDGYFETSVKVIGFTKIFRPGTATK
jgi:hypothetical protein